MRKKRITKSKKVLNNVPLRFAVMKVAAGVTPPPYSRRWVIPDWFSRTEKLDREEQVAKHLKIAQATAPTLREYKKEHYVMKRQDKTHEPTIVLYPILEPAENEWGEVAP